MGFKVKELNPDVIWSSAAGLRSLPSQWSSVTDVKDLVRVEQLPEAVEELPALQTAAFRVDEHQQRTDVGLQLVVLKEDKDHIFIFLHYVLFVAAFICVSPGSLG